MTSSSSNNCTLCELHAEVNYPCIQGRGNTTSRIMVVGEYPHWQADKAGELLTGEPYEYLKKSLQANGINKFYYTTAVKCNLPYGAKIGKTHIKACQPYLYDEITANKPKFILLLGNTALSVVGKSGITTYRGKEFVKDGITYFATFNPSAVLRNPKYEIIFKQDMAYFANLINGVDNQPHYDVKFVESLDDFKQMCKDIHNAKMIAYDFETEAYDPFNGRVWLLGVAYSPTQAWILPLQHEEQAFTTKPLTLLSELARVMMLKPKWRVAHNSKFDNKWFKVKVNHSVKCTWDTMLASHLLNENTPNGLEYLSQSMLGLQPYKGKIVFVDKYDTKGKLIEKVSSLKDMGLYCGEDCCNTYRIALKQIPQVKDDARLWNLYTKLILPASHTLEDIELRGLYMDKARLIERQQTCEDKIVETEAKLNALVPDTYPRPYKIYKKPPKQDYYQTSEGYIVNLPVNFGSPDQVGKLLFSENGFNCIPISLTDSGKPSTGSDDLTFLKDQSPQEVITFVDTLLEYRNWKKKLSTYIQPWIEQTIDRGKDRIYSTFKMLTVTGRLSSENPNVQNLERGPFIRGCVCSPPGYKLVECDYSQIELRIAAHISGEPTMLRAYQTNEDLHALTAATVSGMTLEEVKKDKATRQKGKPVNFGYIYGMSAEGFRTYAKTGYGVDLTMDEAVEFRNKYFIKYKGLLPWHKRQKDLAKRLGYVRFPSGRMRRLPDINSDSKGVRGEAERQGINAPVQGFANEITLLSMVRLNKILDPAEAQIVLSVHDALYFYIKDDCVSKLLPVIKSTMEDADAVLKTFGVDLTVPLVVDCKIGTHWGQLEEMTV